MYTICITFADGSRDQYYGSMMDREGYGAEMRRWEKQYHTEITHVDELSDGNRFIFAVATERAEFSYKNMEKTKSRARYYTKKAEMERV